MTEAKQPLQALSSVFCARPFLNRLDKAEIKLYN